MRPQLTIEKYTLQSYKVLGNIADMNVNVLRSSGVRATVTIVHSLCNVWEFDVRNQNSAVLFEQLTFTGKKMLGLGSGT